MVRTYGSVQILLRICLIYLLVKNRILLRICEIYLLVRNSASLRINYSVAQKWRLPGICALLVQLELWPITMKGKCVENCLIAVVWLFLVVTPGIMHAMFIFFPAFGYTSHYCIPWCCVVAEIIWISWRTHKQKHYLSFGHPYNRCDWWTFERHRSAHWR